MKTVQFAFEIKWPLEAGHQFPIALLTEEGLSMPKKCSEIKMSQESLVDTGLWCVLFWYKLQQYFLYWSILFIIQRIAKVLLSDKRPLMISQLHRLWCFFAYVSQLTLIRMFSLWNKKTPSMEQLWHHQRTFVRSSAFSFLSF